MPTRMWVTVATCFAAMLTMASEVAAAEQRLTFPNGVTLSADVAYSTIPGYRPMTLDVYGAASDSLRPLVVFVHGGAWMVGDKRHSTEAFTDFPAVLADFAARGFVIASIDYRLAREAPFPAAIDDVRAALRFLRANAHRYGIDAQRVALWGASAGAQLAALATLDCGRGPRGDDAANATQSDCVQAAVAWFGVFDFATVPASMAPRAVEVYLGCARDACAADRIEAASPIAHADGKDPPILLLHGDADRLVPLAQSQQLRARLAAAHVPVTLEVIPGVGHGWIGADAAASRAAALRAMELTIRFLDVQLKPAAH